MQKRFLKVSHKGFILGTVNKRLGAVRLFGINTKQYDEGSIIMDSKDKYEALLKYKFKFTCPRRKEVDVALNKAKRAHFTSISSSLRWIGNVVSPL